jgi:hypothetical protein
MKFFVFVFCLSLYSLAGAQISGVVKDKRTGKPIAGAELFINQSTIQTVSASTGAFNLSGVMPGFADLVVYKRGYEVFKAPLRIQSGREYKLNLELVEAVNKAIVKRKADDEQKKNLQWFERALLGTTANTSYCIITNPKVINIVRTGDLLDVTFTEPLLVSNSALGYNIKCFIQDFSAGVQDVTIKGLFRYDSLPTKNDRLPAEWQRNRLHTYWGSERHFFKSLIDGRSRQEGFQLLRPDGTLVAPDSLTRASKIADYTSIILPERLTVQYKNERGTSGVVQTDQIGQQSWIIPQGAIDVNANGIPMSTQSYQVQGYWAQARLADQLPFDYQPVSSLADEEMDWKNFEMLQEQIYLHTDRDYYYPREDIWFKAYLGYAMPALRDTLSRTLYVELISPQRIILFHKILRITNGGAFGDFRLPADLAQGTYYLRAYTQWMQNYPVKEYVKPIAILDPSQNLQPREAISETLGNIRLQTNKTIYKPREQVMIDVSVNTVGAGKRPNLSLAVTDFVAAVPLQTKTSRLTAQSLAPVKVAEGKTYFDKIEHYMERGISFQGRVRDDKGQPVACNLEIIQGNMDNLLSMETDETGVFTITGLTFYDSVYFAIKPFRKNKVFAKVEYIPRYIPEFEYSGELPELTLRSDNALQRIQNTYQAGEDVTLLEEVEITGQKINDAVRKGNIRVYGQPDRTIKGDQLRATSAGTNFLVSLQGKVPGLQVVETFDGAGQRQVVVKIRGGTSSLTGDTSPLILVDGVPFPDANSLVALSPDMVDSVDVITRAVPQFGSRGTNGVISIFTKKGFSASTEKSDYTGFKVAGYNRSRSFTSPDYSAGVTTDPDFRTTLYWNPDLKLDAAGTSRVSFFTADVPGIYRIVAEGIDGAGMPLRVEKFIEVAN